MSEKKEPKAAKLGKKKSLTGEKKKKAGGIKSGSKREKRSKKLRSDKGGKAKKPDSKKAKRNKGVRSESDGFVVERERILRGLICPCCSKRCPLAKPKCGKGRALAKKKAEKVA